MENDTPEVEDWSAEDLDHVVLMEATLQDGTQGKIVYRNGGLVDAVELEALCDKVGDMMPQRMSIH